MSWRTTFSLLVIVAALCAAAWWQRERESTYVEGQAERLFAEVDSARVQSIRIEALDRPPGMRLERDARGEWYLTDPIAYPARPGLVNELLSIVRRNLAQAASPAEIAARQKPFERLGLFEVEEQTSAGNTRKVRIEVGDVDLDGVRLWVRKDGRILRTVRNIDTMLQRSLYELRDDHLLRMRPQDVVRIERSGVDLSQGRADPIDLVATRDVYAWKLERPYRAQLDPGLFSLWLSSLTSLKISGFVDDNVRDLGPYGLANPQVRLRLEDRHGQIQELIFAQAIDGGEWHAHAPGLPYVWELEPGGEERLIEAPENYFDGQLVRVFRADVRKLELINANGRLRVTGRGDSAEPDWKLELIGSGSQEGQALAAERSAVEDILGLLEATDLRHLPELDAAAEFPADARPCSVWIEDVKGLRQGGRIGREYTWTDGTPGRLFLREGDAIVSFAGAEIGQLCQVAAPELLRLRLVDIDEVLARRLVLRTASAERVYMRNTGGLWRHVESKLEATELRPLLDCIFFLKASEHIAEPAQAQALEDELWLELDDARGRRQELRLGRDAAGRVVADLGLPTRAVLADQSLHGRLLELFQP